jgi:uncharacterized membrane protein
MLLVNELLPGFALTLATALVVFGLIYYQSHGSRREFLFTYLVFSVISYLITSLLRDVQITLGFSFGLLAVFTILRYRTEQIPIREMTFLYLSITIPFINALFLATRVSFPEIAIVNAGIALFVLVVDRLTATRHEIGQTVYYEKIEMIKPERYEELLDDLRDRTGLYVKRCDVEEIDFLRDTARLTIYYDYPIKARRTP